MRKREPGEAHSTAFTQRTTKPLVKNFIGKPYEGKLHPEKAFGGLMKGVLLVCTILLSLEKI